ncbi:MAG TPA: RNA polymerase sigma-54 factor, partial [Rikenellaceae bacterium]|nr:RNA polymerase sigma-54 factor [Rikenellaceae bacterium]
MIKQGLEIKQTQKMSPLQILTIKLIELPVQSLEQKVRSEIEENPVLDDGPDPDRPDESKDISIDELKDDDYIPAYKTRVNNWGKDARPEYNTFSVKESFNQKLMDQLGCRNLDKHQYDIAAFLIGSLDGDGYLRRDIESLVDDMAFRAGIETSSEEVLSVLKIIQDFEPTGVGARDLRECLLLQLRACRQTKEVKDAENILEN